MVERGGDVDSRFAPERRAYPRFKLRLAGLCSASGGVDVPCLVVDMSMGGAALSAEIDAPVGAAVIASLPQVGLLRGRMTRIFPGGLAIAFEEGRSQRERLAGYLTWLIAQRLEGDLDDRGSERIVPLRRVTAISVAGAPTATARIVDVSRSGVALTTTAPVAVGDPVTVGDTQALVVRVFSGGFAAHFVDPLDTDLDATIIL